MEFYHLSREREAVRRFTEELWLPFNRDLETTVEAFALTEDLDISSEVEFRMDMLDSDTYEAVIAVDGGGNRESLTAVDGKFVGFITTDINEAPDNFAYRDRLLIGDFYVKEEYRGEGLAQQLMDRAVERARENDCGELTLDVAVDNDRARAFYESYDFEPHKLTMVAPVEDG